MPPAVHRRPRIPSLAEKRYDGGMKHLPIVLLLLFGAGNAQAQQFDLPLIGRTGLNIYSAMTYYEVEDGFFTDGISKTRNRLVRIDLQRGTVAEHFEVHRFLGAVEERMLVSTVDRDHILQQLLIDPFSLAANRAPKWEVSLDWALLLSPDGSLYSAGLSSSGTYTPFRFDAQGRRQAWLDVEGVPTSISSDNLHLLIQSPETGEVFVWSTDEESVRARLRSSDTTGQVRFLTNGVFLLPPQYAGQESWRLYDVEGQQVAELRFRITGAEPLFFWFTSDLRRAVVCVRGAVNPETAVVKTEAFRRWLQREGHLFVATRGVLNDSRVRVRAYPTLSAQTLGHLDAGEQVEVLERSGRRQRIGEMNAYWYRVRNEEGLAGWSYGHFIDLQ